MKPTTIDNLDLRAHERYAQDQQKLDPLYTVESSSSQLHSELAVTSVIYASKWEELFQLNLKHTSWAAFTPPPKYHLQTNRFFKARIAPSLKDREEEKENSHGQDHQEEELDPKDHDSFKHLVRAILETKLEGKSLKALELEKSSLLNLLDKVKHLNILLSYANARKTQYQKG